MINVGSAETIRAYLGNTRLCKVYIGNTLVFLDDTISIVTSSLIDSSGEYLCDSNQNRLIFKEII